ncbi:MAG: hypothetical protein JKY17_06590 [Magnetovibrio sp.]|nr:hypothetical protein [Magnetovibrio sp.]
MTDAKPDKVKEFAAAIFSTRTVHWQALVQGGGIGPDVQKQMDICVALDPLQTELVNQARKKCMVFKKMKCGERP